MTGESGARNVDHILTGSLLPEMSREFLARLAEGQRPNTGLSQMNASGHEERIYCNCCHQTTRHNLLASRQNTFQDEVEGVCSVDCCKSFDVFECAGCGEITVKRTDWCSEWEEADIVLVPPREYHRQPEWITQLPHPFWKLLREVYAAIYGNSRRLAAIGLRSLLDDLMTEQIGDIGGFRDKLKKMKDDGSLSANDFETLEATVDLGHAATHRGYTPTDEQLALGLNIVEGALFRFHVQKGSTKQLAEGIPPRAKKKAADDVGRLPPGQA